MGVKFWTTIYCETTAHCTDLQKSLPRLWARRGGAVGRSCCQQALSRCCCLRGHEVRATIAPRSRMLDASQCHTPAEHRLPRGNIYQQSHNILH